MKENEYQQFSEYLSNNRDNRSKSNCLKLSSEKNRISNYVVYVSAFLNKLSVLKVSIHFIFYSNLNNFFLI